MKGMKEETVTMCQKKILVTRYAAACRTAPGQRGAAGPGQRGAAGRSTGPASREEKQEETGVKIIAHLRIERPVRLP